MIKMKKRLKRKEYGWFLNGNVYNQGEFIFIWAVILIYILGMWLFMLRGTSEIRREYCEILGLTVKEISYEYGENSVKLRFTVWENDTEYEAFSWYDRDSMTDIPTGGWVTVLIHKDEVAELTYSGTKVASLEAKNLHRAKMRKISHSMLIFAAVWAVYVAVSWYVMYNAEKFPRLIKIFVKPEYINKEKVYGKR